ncbi:hypothetical protein CHARACLAT_018126 [Characodon lateralis]|uniref:Uncharacterized protein n=1 Tax=Characodon lateralis TaxID=208331 RepID=A0ABU7F4F3_9TELE|nr:hypothetical protein [Characodon lateralis]
MSIREMIRPLNPRYQYPSKNMLSNTLIPAWYAVEKGNVKRELQDVRDVAVTAGWVDQCGTRPLLDCFSPLCERGYHEGENPAYQGSIHITDRECNSQGDGGYS